VKSGLFVDRETGAITTADQNWMRLAMSLARQAETEGEVPVGAVIVLAGEQVGAGWNRVIACNDPSAHAEIMALRQAGSKLGNYRLPECTLYVSLEPCCRCAGAIVHARISRVVFGAADPTTGAAGSVFDVLVDPRHNHALAVTGGCLGEECGEQLKQFFKRKRESVSP
jgi:tRNA(adenine34) deaminase